MASAPGLASRSRRLSGHCRFSKLSRPILLAASRRQTRVEGRPRLGHAGDLVSRFCFGGTKGSKKMRSRRRVAPFSSSPHAGSQPCRHACCHGHCNKLGRRTSFLPQGKAKGKLSTRQRSRPVGKGVPLESAVVRHRRARGVPRVGRGNPLGEVGELVVGVQGLTWGFISSFQCPVGCASQAGRANQGLATVSGDHPRGVRSFPPSTFRPIARSDFVTKVISSHDFRRRRVAALKHYEYDHAEHCGFVAQQIDSEVSAFSPTWRLHAASYPISISAALPGRCISLISTLESVLRAVAPSRTGSCRQSPLIPASSPNDAERFQLPIQTLTHEACDDPRAWDRNMAVPIASRRSNLSGRLDVTAGRPCHHSAMDTTHPCRSQEQLVTACQSEAHEARGRIGRDGTDGDLAGCLCISA
jgi:hypothetical protein